MAIYKYGDKVPIIGKNSYVSDSARVIGDVIIGNNVYIGHGAIIRGDYGKIEIGDGSAIEEGAILHIRPNGLLKIEDNVTVGHGAVIHCNHIKSFAVIGLNATISFDVIIGKWVIVAEGCLVPKGKVIEDELIIAGAPYKILGKVQKKHKDFWIYAKKLYNNLAKEYPHNFIRIA